MKQVKHDMIVQKPLSVAHSEFMSNMINIINSCGLPPLVIESVIKDLYAEVKSAAREQYERDKKQYEQALAIEQGSVENIDK